MQASQSKYNETIYADKENYLLIGGIVYNLDFPEYFHHPVSQ